MSLMTEFNASRVKGVREQVISPDPTLYPDNLEYQRIARQLREMQERLGSNAIVTAVSGAGGVEYNIQDTQ